jgi:hypothetical protein
VARNNQLTARQLTTAARVSCEAHIYATQRMRGENIGRERAFPANPEADEETPRPPATASRLGVSLGPKLLTESSRAKNAGILRSRLSWLVARKN